MAGWAREELARVDSAQELDLASVRDDGTLRRPVMMWLVSLGEDILVRSVNGRSSPWFRGATTRHEARVAAGGVTRDVTLIETDDLLDEIDDAYEAKYVRRYPTIVPSIVTNQARAATLRLVPR